MAATTEESSPLPNLIRCANGNCHHNLDWDGSDWPDPGRKSYPCPIPSCDAGRMTMRCGGQKVNGDRCYKLCQPGAGCSEHPKDGSEPSSSFKDQGGARGKSARGNKRKKKNSAKILPRGRGNGKPVPGRYVASHLREAYKKARDDKEAQGAFIHEIALFRARVDELQRMLETTESPAAWRRLGAQSARVRRLLGKIQEHAAAAAGLKENDPNRRAHNVKANDANRKLLALLSDEMLPTIEQGVGPDSIHHELRQISKRLEGIQRAKAQMEKPLSRIEVEATLQRVIILMDQILAPAFEEYPGLAGAYTRFLTAVHDEMTYDPREPFQLPVGLPEVVEDGNGRPGEKVIEAAGSG